MASRRPRPPVALRVLAGILLSGLGLEGRLIRGELHEAWERDVARGVGRWEAAVRYGLNLLGSAWSLSRHRLARIGKRGFGLDFRLGLRMLRKEPVLTGVALLALGLGIPATLSFHHLLGAILSPLPVPEGERVLGIRHVDRQRGRPVLSTVHDLERWSGGLTSFGTVAAASQPFWVNLDAGRGDPPVRAAELTASAFEVLRTPPVLGRSFVSLDEVPGAPAVVILGEDLWTVRYARDPQIVGRVVRIGRTEHTVVGVMPDGFAFPRDESLWLPFRARSTEYVLGEGPRLMVFGRLVEDATRESASQEMRVAAARVAQDAPEVYAHHVGQALPMALLILGEEDFSRGNTELYVTQAFIFAALLLVCGNVAVLVLARAAGRMGEITIRRALGAGRIRLVFQFFVEALVLALAATGVGLIAAEVTTRWLMGFAELLNLPYWMDLTLGAETVLTALGLAAVCAVVTSIIPALRATGADVRGNLQRMAGGATMKFGLGSTLLIVTEIVLSVGFLAFGSVRLASVFPTGEGRLGLDPDRYLTGRVDVDSARPHDVAARQRAIADRIAGIPGVGGVGMGTSLPGDIESGWNIVPEEDGPGEHPGVHFSEVDVHFFDNLNRPILAGRNFMEADAEDTGAETERPVIVNTSFVEQILQGRNAVGRTLRELESRRSDSTVARYLIVGVVGPFGTNILNPRRDAAVYAPMAPGSRNPLGYLVEADGDASAMVATFRAAVTEVHPEAMARTVMPLSDRMRSERSIWRWMYFLHLMMAGVAFLLSISGLYALMSFTVAQRTREIGIRTALGAHPLVVAMTVGRRAALQLGLGLVLGGALSWVILLQFANEPVLNDVDIPMTVALTTALAGLIGVLACTSPTLRALRVPPTEALRES